MFSEPLPACGELMLAFWVRLVKLARIRGRRLAELRVGSGRDQQDMVAIDQHQLPLEGARLAAAAEEVGGGIRYRDELRGEVREGGVQGRAAGQVQIGADREPMGVDLDVGPL